MKTYTKKIRYWAVLSSLSLMATAFPAFSQTDSSSSQSGSQSQPGTSLHQPATTSGAQNTPADSSVTRMSPADNTGTPINEPSGADNSSAGNWSWIGLLGLFGLFGLKRRHEAHDETYRPARAA